MNQQEIKENLPQLPFFASSILNGEIVSVKGNLGNTICEVETQAAPDIDEAICRAIVHAINNTYGNGINPESVPEMHNALTIVAKDLTELKLYDAANTIQSILNKAAL